MLLCLEKTLQTDVDMIILREKDLHKDAYMHLADRVIRLCTQYQKLCILHYFWQEAAALKYPYVHVTMNQLKLMTDQDKKKFEILGVSTHSVEEAIEAEYLGASYITASHIFPTDCKKGLEPRGLSYLRETVQSVHIPVYALGGIHPDRIQDCIDTGAAGVCMMSEYMKI